ncbi:aldo/keto reductase [Cellulomonas chengniuliangii]|uniref:Aldo/keto reductase n=1 Tax=Cellulomonas chengniuliangii TaxID=2968084 RepID=A0ABY5KXG1_9CELL|nr:aldo/keto reductase [Cellulomonas chengniuliangii]MCC2309143.1 aldo/keto reductase [Cellulomonas chengniuliangii]UUI74141.1 aldo/keto reductase [Cellulomonas chengniuliangii]
MPSTSPDIPGPLPLRPCGRSGLRLPEVTLGLWQNFGEATPFDAQRELVLRAIDLGVTHLDLANNYGPPPGAAEATVGRLLARELSGRRDELVIATKAGYRQWPGPYGEHGSRKYLLASLDQSLRRLGLDHVDLFYSHRFDPRTPLEETIGALGAAIASGRARAVGISSYSARRTVEALEAADTLGVPITVCQPSYSMLNRWIERPDPAAGGRSLLDVAADAGLGVAAFSPLAQGMLTDRYLAGVPEDSRAARGGPLSASYLTEENLAHVRALDAVARRRGQSLAQLAITWALRDPRVTTVVLGARTPAQLEQNLAALAGAPLGAEELEAIEADAVDAGVNLWGPRSSDL